MLASTGAGRRYAEAFRRGLRELAHVQGWNIAIEYRVAEGNPERFFVLAAELARLNGEVIVLPQGMNPRLRRALPKLMATVVLAAGVAIVLILARPRDGDMSSHGHHLADLREEGIRLQQQGDLAGALAKFREAVRIAERQRLKPALAANRIAIATVHLTEGRYEDAARELQQALAAAREIGNRMEAAAALAYLGQTRRLQGRPEEAAAALRQALDLVGDVPARPRALAHFQMGELRRARGDLGGALAEYREAHAVLREMRDVPGQAAILISIGRMQAALGDVAAASTLTQARDVLRQLGYTARAAEVEAEMAALAANR